MQIIDINKTYFSSFHLTSSRLTCWRHDHLSVGTLGGTVLTLENKPQRPLLWLTYKSL